MEDAQTHFAAVSCLGKIHISGQSSPEFIRVMTTVELERLEVPGLLAPALVLNAEGEILDLVMLGRTGEQEFLLINNPETTDELFEWLQAHAELLTPEGAAVFEDLSGANTTEHIATFALYGPEAHVLLNELCAADVLAKLERDTLATFTIGQLQVLLLRWPFLRNLDDEAHSNTAGEVFEVYLPAQAADDFEQILLGFAEIDPEDYEDYKTRRKRAHTWFAAAEQAAYIKPETRALKALLRQSHDFVGARALEQYMKNR